MGKVKTKLVKRAARELLEKYPDLFKRDFNYNKQVVSKLTITSSKKLRNQIAGYITHLLAVSAKREKRVELPEVPSESGA
ncbi:MAG: 30S ribosomal protein S17e [Desulfurococcaceae archaeon]|jgi:small subunit ribosomal protein S17e